MRLVRTKEFVVTVDGEQVHFTIRCPVVRDIPTFVGLKKSPDNESPSYIALLEALLIGWRGLQDEDGKEIPFSKEFIQELPLQIGNALVTQISDWIGGVFRGD